MGMPWVKGLVGSSPSSKNLHAACQSTHSLDDMTSTDASLVHQFGWCTRARHRLDRQFNDLWHRSIVPREHLHHCLTKTALGPVILDGDKLISSILSRGKKRFGIDRLDRVGIDHTRSYALAQQLIVGFERLVQRNASRDNRSLICSRLAYNFAAPHRESLVRSINHRGLLTRGPHIDDTVMLSH